MSIQANKRSKAGKTARSAASRKATKRSADRRTTLRVPRSLDIEVSRVSEELGISGNEALVRLAARGAESARRERALREVIERRHAAVRGVASHDAAAPFPSASEMREAILIDRE